MHGRKVVDGFGKKSFVSTGVRKPGNTCVTDHHMTLAVKVVLTSLHQHILSVNEKSPLTLPQTSPGFYVSKVQVF